MTKNATSFPVKNNRLTAPFSIANPDNPTLVCHVSAMIDTGADVCAIDQRLAKKLKLSVMDVATMHTVNRSSEMPVYNLRVGFDGIAMTVPAVGVKQLTGLLVGMNFISRGRLFVGDGFFKFGIDQEAKQGVSARK